MMESELIEEVAEVRTVLINGKFANIRRLHNVIEG